MKRITILLAALLLGISVHAEQNLDLGAYLSMVESNNLQLASAEKSQDLAGVRAKLAKSAFMPVIAGRAGYSRNILDITASQPVGFYADSSIEEPAGSGLYPVIPVMGEVVVNMDNDYSLGLSLQQTVFDMKAISGIEASGEYQKLAGLIYDGVREELYTGAKKLFYQCLLLDEVFKVKQASEQNAYENYLELEKKKENGLASLMDVLQAEVNWKMMIPETTKAGKNRDLAMLNLKNLAGIEAGTEITLSGSLSEVPGYSTELVFSDILGSRPDYLALENKRKLSRINAEAAAAGFYPALSFSAVCGWQASDDGFNLAAGKTVLTLGLTLDLPLYYGGSRFAMLEQAQLELEQAELEIRQKLNEIRAEFDNILLSLSEAQHRIASAEQTLKTAGQAYEITRLSLKSGLTTQLALKDSGVSLEGAKLQYYAAIYDYLSAYFDWQKAAGRGAWGM